MFQQLDVGLGGDVFEKVGAAAHDEPRRQAAFGAGPDGQPLLDQLLRQRVERGLGLLLELADIGLGFGQRAAVDVSVEEVRRLLQLRRGRAGRQLDDAVLDVAVLRDQHGQRLGRLELDELDVLERHLVLGGEHHAGAARHARQHLAGLGQHVLQRGAVARRPDLRLDDAALLVGQVAELHEGVDEEAQALAASAAGRPRCAAHRSRPRCSRSLITLRIVAGDSDERQQARQVARADRLAVPAGRNRRSSGRCRASAHRASAGPGRCRSWASTSEQCSRSTRI